VKNLLRPHYRDLQGYVSAGMEMAKDPDKIFLNANENPHILPGLEGLNRYPEPQPKALAAAYAEVYGVEPEQIVMTRGADEAIAVLTKLFCEPASEQSKGDAVLICPPTFGMYGVNARAMPAQVVEVQLLREGGTFALDKDGILKAVIPAANEESLNSGDPEKDSSIAADVVDSVRANPAAQNANGMTEGGRVKIVYLCSPNNPSGTSFNHETISEICEALEGHAIVVLDETYAEFAEQGSMAEDLDSTPNLIILRTLSKSYALAGMRMGSMLCGDEDFVALIKAKALDAYPLPQLSIEAAFHVLSPEIRAQAQENIRKLIAERKRMQEALPKASALIQHIYPSDANFLLVEMERAAEFHTFCEENGVILRNFTDKPGTENCLRLSIGLPEENERVLDLLRRFS